MDQIHEAIREMLQWEQGYPKRIQHFLKVHSFCRYLGQEEGLDPETLHRLELTAVVHDIGILPADQKYGRHDGPFQEREGIEPARALLRRIGVAEKDVERISFVVGHHHTFRGVDGIDWQILLEADFLVNSLEKGLPMTAVQRAMDTVYHTESGKQLLRLQYPEIVG